MMNEIPTVPIYYYFIEENPTNRILIFFKTLIVAPTIRKPFLQFQLFVIYLGNADILVGYVQEGT